MIDYLALAKQTRARIQQPAPAPAPAGDPGALDVARLLGLPLDRFAAEGQPLEARVPWWPTTHFFVPTTHDLEALAREGIGRERIWLPAELAELVDIDASVEDLRARTMGKLVVRVFGGEVTDILKLPRWTEK